MKITDFFKNMMNRIKGKDKSQNQFLLDVPNGLYSDLISSEKIEGIISKMPENLTKIEKAYYVYIELGKILKESPTFVFTNGEGKKEHYNDKIDSDYYGICKSISELYVSVLKDKRIGIDADLVKKYPDAPTTHVDTVLNIDGKHYMANLISDLSRIKTAKRVNSFGFNLDRRLPNKEQEADNLEYLSRLKQHYGEISTIDRKEIEQMDKKIGYSYYMPNMKLENDRGMYTEDVIDALKQDMENPESFKKYVLHGKDVPPEYRIKYLLDYIMGNIDKYSTYNGEMGYLERIIYYIKIAEKMLSREEQSRIEPYVAMLNDDPKDLISILKVKVPGYKPDGEEPRDIVYYVFSNDENKYVEKSPVEMKAILEDLKGKKMRIVGNVDRYNPKSLDVLEMKDRGERED